MMINIFEKKTKREDNYEQKKEKIISNYQVGSKSSNY